MSNGSDEVSEVVVDGSSFAGSTKSLTRSGAKRKIPTELWWRITITLAVIIIACFIIYKTVADNQKPTKTALDSFSNDQKPTEKLTNKESKKEAKCEDGSIANSQAAFTFIPLTLGKPYRTYGLEFNFDEVKNKPGVESTMTRLESQKTSKTSKFHYYYNIARCRIGGELQLDIKPHIRGPIVFAVDEQCSVVHYFTEGEGWSVYISARNITCSRHGKEEIKVDELSCLEGAIENSNASFVYLPFGASELYRATGVEFSFETVATKTILGSVLTKLNELDASSPKIHYYYNIARCRIGGGLRLDKKPHIRGPLVFAIDEQCSKVYYFVGRHGWKKYISATDVTCSSRGEYKNESRCFDGSIEGSHSSFKFRTTSLKTPNVTGIKYNFATLVKKLEGLITDYNLTNIVEMDVSMNASYYLNLHRCYNGGPANLDVIPQVRGPVVFAIDGECSKVFYLSSKSYQWVKYRSASDIKCFDFGK